MDLYLKTRRESVAQAQTKLRLANAAERHRSLNAKRDCKKLILSAKGLTAIFLSGSLKGAVSETNMNWTSFSTFIAKKYAAEWLKNTK
jgi:hypothetical protein